MTFIDPKSKIINLPVKHSSWNIVHMWSINHLPPPTSPAITFIHTFCSACVMAVGHAGSCLANCVLSTQVPLSKPYASSRPTLNPALEAWIPAVLTGCPLNTEHVLLFNFFRWMVCLRLDGLLFVCLCPSEVPGTDDQSAQLTTSPEPVGLCTAW